MKNTVPATISTSVPLKIVVIGGGTGNSTVLSGLKPLIGDGLTTVVNTFDDGGGTGKIREVYQSMPAVGDLRQCLISMSNAPEDVRGLFNHRFDEGSHSDELNLYGQTLGNLIIAGAVQRNGGNLSEAVSLVGRAFDITGTLVPASHDNRRLRIELPDGQLIEGQHQAEEVDVPSLRGAKVSFDVSPTRISDEAKAAIKAANMVVLAPGDLYTSLAPVLVMDGMKEALQEAHAVILVVNLMNRNRHTVDFTALDYAQEYDRLIGDHVIDRVIYNTEPLNPKALAAQAALGSHPVIADAKALRAAGYVPVGKRLLSHKEIKLQPNDIIAASRSTIRHDPIRVAHALMATYFGNGFAARRSKA